MESMMKKPLLPPKTMWSKEEDNLLTAIVKQMGPRKWNSIAEHIPGRTGKQCRERWMSHISPELISSTWDTKDDDQLIQLHNLFGNKWAKISQYFPGRPPNAVKNRWNCILRRQARNSRGSPCPSASAEAPQETLNEPIRIPTDTFFDIDSTNLFEIDESDLFSENQLFANEL